MQFLILMVGSLVFVFYQFHEAPLFFNKTELGKVEQTAEYKALVKQNTAVFTEKKKAVEALYSLMKTNSGDEKMLQTLKVKALAADKKANELRSEVKDLMLKTNPDANTNDTNYIFLSFVTKYLPQGMVGLLIAVILLASMGAMASAFSSLTSCTIVDIYQRMIHKEDTEKHYVNASKLVTLGWGIVCIIVAQFTANIGSLIEAVNILGSWFYGTILGVFLVAFYFKSIKGDAVFWAALLAEVFVIYAWWIDLTAFLWLNVIGCVLVIVFAWVMSLFNRRVVNE
jgi:Na+(H+)/acetate symporter ActP